MLKSFIIIDTQGRKYYAENVPSWDVLLNSIPEEDIQISKIIETTIPKSKQPVIN